MNLESTLTYSQGQLVRGEYNVVARASRDVEALMLVHALPITRRDAKALAARVLHAHGLNDVVVGFTSSAGNFRFGAKGRMVPLKGYDGQPLYHWRTGKPRKRRALVRDAAGAIVYQSSISLPRRPYDPQTGGGLRVGLVLHECAHAIDYSRRKRSPHDATFTAILDGLIERH